MLVWGWRCPFDTRENWPSMADTFTTNFRSKGLCFRSGLSFAVRIKGPTALIVRTCKPWESNILIDTSPLYQQSHPASKAFQFWRTHARKTLHDSREIFVEHALHVARIQVSNPGLIAVNLVQRFINRRILALEITVLTRENKIDYPEVWAAAIQEESPFFLLTQENKKRICSQGAVVIDSCWDRINIQGLKRTPAPKSYSWQNFSFLI